MGKTKEVYYVFGSRFDEKRVGNREGKGRSFEGVFVGNLL